VNNQLSKNIANKY